MSAEKIPAKPGKETVYVDVEDEITAIIDKVDAAKQKVVALVLPKRATTLQSVVNMRLLKRNAEKSGKSVVLITSEPALLPLAGAVGLHVAKSLQSKPEIPPSPLETEAPAAIESPIEESSADVGDDPDMDSKPAKIDYNRSIGELAAAHEVEDEEPDVITLGDDEELPKPKTPKSSAPKQAKASKLKVPNFERFRLVLFGGIALFIALIVFIFLAIFVLPKAKITIQTNSSPISANLTLEASDKYTTLNDKASQIPAVLKASNQTSQQSVPATGQQNQGDKATGTMTFYNCNKDDTLSGTTHTVPAGTGVSAGGLTYITQQPATVSPSHFTGNTCKNDVASSSVNIKSQNGGAKYNQASTTYSVSGFSTITGTGSAMTGGTDNNVTIVSQQDVDNARAKVTSQSADDYTNKFIKQLEDGGAYVLKSTLKVGDPAVTATPAVGQPASTTNVSIQITYTVLIVQKSDLTKLINGTLEEQIDKTKQKISTTDVLKDASVTVQNQTAPGAATLNVSETTTAVPIIDVALVKKLSAGQKSGNIKATISAWPGIKNVDVKTSPFWVSKVPKKQNKITVVLQQVKQ
jgi:hypothetical protein